MDGIGLCLSAQSKRSFEPCPAPSKDLYIVRPMPYVDDLCSVPCSLCLRVGTATERPVLLRCRVLTRGCTFAQSAGTMLGEIHAGTHSPLIPLPWFVSRRQPMRGQGAFSMPYYRKKLKMSASIPCAYVPSTWMWDIPSSRAEHR